MKKDNNKDLFLNLVSEAPSTFADELEERVNNQDWRHESKIIAFKVLKAIKEQEIKQRDLAFKMGVSPQQISKIVKGKENLTLATIVKLQNILKINILESCSQTKSNDNPTTTSYSTDLEPIQSTLLAPKCTGRISLSDFSFQDVVAKEETFSIKPAM